MSEGSKVKRFYFVDQKPREKSLDEHQVMFGPSIDGEGVDLYQCTEAGYFDEDAVMMVVERGASVSVADDNFHQAVRCQLVSEPWLEEADDGELKDVEVVDVPEQFMGVNLPEAERLDENQMASFKLSINMARSTEQERETGGGRGSIWRKLGEKIGRVF
ncbi:hypothetical protein [Haloarcula rara]|uniref:hypothetical protein n=1 Tax=Haloarcula rara TaxID=3033387 RepID=UPI0023E84955|nr:hypothetical protein [Halomicroarcula sp. SHR3]